MIQGYDVSNYQAEHFPLTDSVNDKPIDFAIIKVTEGLGYVNPKWRAQRDWARSHGMSVGYYHFGHKDNIHAQVDYFLSKLTLLPGEHLWFDWETNPTNNTYPSGAQKDDFIRYAKSKAPGHKVGLYCNTYFWKNHDVTSYAGDGLWIATGGPAAGQPPITAPWVIHQYSTANSLDHDVASFESRAAMKAWSGEAGEKDVALTKADAVTLYKTDDVLKAGNPTDTNKFWTAESYFYETFKEAEGAAADARAAKVAVAGVGKQVEALAKKVDALATGGVDLDALAKKVADLLAARLAD